ncbi:MAG: hypothetical protein ABSG15_07460 [FCB group bacterium]
MKQTKMFKYYKKHLLKKSEIKKKFILSYLTEFHSDWTGYNPVCDFFNGNTHVPQHKYITVQDVCFGENKQTIEENNNRIL